MTDAADFLSFAGGQPAPGRTAPPSARGISITAAAPEPQPGVPGGSATADLPPEAVELYGRVRRAEGTSRGDGFVFYGSQPFTPSKEHPGEAAARRAPDGRPTHAAGPGQWQPDTWNGLKPDFQKRFGRSPDFSSDDDQKRMTWLNAEKAYGPNLAADIRAGKLNTSKLAGQWAGFGQPWMANTTATSGWRVSDGAIADEARRGSSVVYVDPFDFLALLPAIDDSPRERRKGESLSRSLSSGDNIEAIPTLDVTTDKSGRVGIRDYDGRHRAQEAISAGVGMIPVALHGLPKDYDAKTIEGASGAIRPFNFRPVPNTTPDKLAAIAGAGTPRPAPSVQDRVAAQGSGQDAWLDAVNRGVRSALFGAIPGGRQAAELGSAAGRAISETGPGSRILGATARGATEGFGHEPVGFSDKKAQELREAGVFNDPSRGPDRTALDVFVGGARDFLEEGMRGGAAALDAVPRGVNALLRGGAFGVGQIAQEIAGNPHDPIERNRLTGALVEAGNVIPAGLGATVPPATNMLRSGNIEGQFRAAAERVEPLPIGSPGVASAPVGMPPAIAEPAAAPGLASTSRAASGDARASSAGVTPERAALAREAIDTFGIPLSPSQIGLTPTQRAAETLTRHIPLSGAGQDVAHAVATQRAFNRATAKTFGEEAEAITPEVMDRARRRIGGVLEEIETSTPVKLDDRFMMRLAEVEDEARLSLVDQEFAVVQRQIENILGRVDARDELPGKTAGNLLHRNAALDRAAGSANPNIAAIAGELREALQDALQRSLSGEQLAAYKNARAEWKAMKTVEPIVARAPTGDIDPMALNTRVSQQYERRAFDTSGTALDRLGKIGAAFLRKTEHPGSGAVRRAVKAGEIALAVGGALTHPAAALAAPVVVGGARLMANRLRSPALANQIIDRALPSPQPEMGGNTLLRLMQVMPATRNHLTKYLPAAGLAGGTAQRPDGDMAGFAHLMPGVQ